MGKGFEGGASNSVSGTLCGVAALVVTWRCRRGGVWCGLAGQGSAADGGGGSEPITPAAPDTPSAPLLRSNPFFDMPLQPVESPYPNPNAFTRAMGENGGGGNVFQAQLPVVHGESLRPANQLAAPVKMRPIEGRTYGMYSNTPVLETNSIQPFTPYIAPQQLQSSGIESLVQNNSAPRTSVFKRS